LIPLIFSLYLVCVGDSLTQLPFFQNYCAISQEHTTLNLSLSGKTSAYFADQVETGNLTFNLDTVSILLGNNDAGGGVSGAEYAQNIQTIIDAIPGNVLLITPIFTQTNLYWATYTVEEINDLIYEYKGWLKLISITDPNVYYLNIQEVEFERSDGIHLTAAGQETLRAIVDPAVTTVPEPSTTLMFLTGAVGLAYLKKIKK